jgi:hypothetical protein
VSRWKLLLVLTPSIVMLMDVSGRPKSVESRGAPGVDTPGSMMTNPKSALRDVSGRF